MATLEELRSQIDSVDKQLVALLDQRAELAKAIGATKMQEGRTKFYDASRQKKVVENAIAASTGSFPPEAIRNVFVEVMSDHDEEAALIKLRTPLQTPIPVAQIKDGHARLFADSPQHFRYFDEYQASEDDTAPADPLLQEIVDLYFNAVGLKMNAFVLDELRLVRQRFPAEMVRRTFRRAQQNEIRSLHWVVQELVKQKKKTDEENSVESA